MQEKIERQAEFDRMMRVHLVNPSDTSFGTAVITPRWLYVLAAATPESFGDPVICDETLEHLDPLSIAPSARYGAQTARNHGNGRPTQ